MKIIIAVLILCFSVNLISGFRWFGFGSDEKLKQTTKSLDIQKPITHLQQQKNLINPTNSQRQADNINKKSSPIIPQNRFQGIVYQGRQQAFNNYPTFRQINRGNSNTNNRIVQLFNPANRDNKTAIPTTIRRTFPQTSLSKFILAESKINNANNNQPQSALGKLIVPSTKTGFRRVLSTKVKNNQQILLDHYQQPRWRPFYPRDNSPLSSALKQRRRRRNVQNVRPSIILARDESSNQDSN